MRRKKRTADAPPDADRTLPSAGFSLPPAEEVIVPWHPDPPSAPPDKKIHPRRSIPPTPEATTEPDRSSPDQGSPTSTTGPQ
ncbi:MAG TPA: hypothetical protein VGD58_29820 [Herpetosiphonaceae bacterium]